MTALAREILARLTDAFEPHRDPERAAAMSAYLRNRFPFLGIMKPERVQLSRGAIAGLADPTERDLSAVAAAGWKRPEREYQYAACWYLRRHARRLGPGFIADAQRLIVTKSWWDTVDDLASNVVGPLVRAHPELRDEMDGWIGSENIWLARTAIIHQLRYRADTDEARLFRYCLHRAADSEFFIRKAIGWALRSYAKAEPEPVAGFLVRHGDRLSGLSLREAERGVAMGRQRRATGRAAGA